jgi:transposase
MRGPDEQTSHMFSYLSPEERVRPDHPLRPIRAMTERVFAELSPRFTKMYSDIGRPSIPPEQLLRALVIQSLYTIRSERLLMEEIDYSVLYRWFIAWGWMSRFGPSPRSVRIATGCSTAT